METPTRVLIVDDDDQIRELLSNYLSDYSIASEGVSGGEGMREAMRNTTFDAIILDLMLPGESGLTLCRQLRATTEIPIIMLTARGEPIDRVVGLELGADDYMIKPFDPRELVARIHSILRRAKAGQRPEKMVAAAADQIEFDGWKLNRTLRQLTTPQQMLVPLSNAEFRLLWTFVERPRRILSRDQLMDAARGLTATAFDRSIDILVSRLRQKLGDDPKSPTLIKTVHGEGYLFDAEVIR